MKKRSLVVIAVGLLFTVSSCGSSWSCKKRYCDADTNQNNTEATIVVTSNNA